MAQESPSNIAYLQAAEILKKLRLKYSTIKNKDPDQISALISETLTQFVNQIGKALTEYDPILHSEVPHSQKVNRFYSSLQTDINLLEDQIDLLNASTIAAHNFVKTEILKAQRENEQLRNKLKVLEIYANSDDDSLIYFGDSFITEEQIDWTLINQSDRATVLGSGALSLSVSSTKTTLNAKPTVKILSGSNGFLGNNQEITDPSVAYTNPITQEKEYKFASEIARRANLLSIIDNQPNTWLEFEKYKVSEDDRSKARGLDFQYSVTNDDVVSYLKTGGLVSGDAKIDWGNGFGNGDYLKLNLEIDLKASKQVNVIKILPYGLQDNINTPIKITAVKTSLNGTDWVVLNPESVWVSNAIDKNVSQINQEKIVVGSATWVTDGSSIRYIRVFCEQPKSIQCNIGHLYYLPKDSVSSNTQQAALTIPSFLSSDGVAYNVNAPYDSAFSYLGALPTKATSTSTSLVEGDIPRENKSESSIRVAGPIPPVTNPQMYYSGKNALVNNLVQKREYFTGQRWVIGLRDITADENQYAAKSVMVSKKFNIPGVVDRVGIEADIQLPDTYDQSTPWITFFISPDDGASWYQISRIQDDFLDIPEILAFNDPTAKDLRQPGVGYYDVTGTVNSLRVKIEITRPSTDTHSTPIVKSYKLKIVKR